MWKETECTGDYGLSDLLPVNDEVLDFVDAFFQRHTKEDKNET